MNKQTPVTCPDCNWVVFQSANTLTTNMAANALNFHNLLSH